MILNANLAQDIVNKTTKIINKNINIIDSSGIIIGSGTSSRLNTFHQGAFEVIKTGQTVEISRGIVKDMQGTQPGINLPITFNGQLIGVVGITGEPDEVRNFGALIKTLVETMLQQFFLMEQVDTEKRATQFLAQEILGSNIEGKEDSILSRAYILGYDLSIHRTSIVIRIEEMQTHSNPDNKVIFYNEYNKYFNHSLKDSIFNCISNYACNESQDIISHITANRFVIFKKTPDNTNKKKLKDYYLDFCRGLMSTLHDKLNLNSTIAIGPSYSGIQGIKSSYEDALETLNIGIKLKGPGDVYSVDDVGIGFLLNSIPQNQVSTFLQQVLDCNSSVNDRLDDVSKETLNALFSKNLNLSETAKSLYIHRNTLLYRIKNIQKSTNRDPRNFDDAVELKLLMLLDKLKTNSNNNFSVNNLKKVTHI